MAMPRADRAARSRRVRSPTPASRTRSDGRSRRRGRQTVTGAPVVLAGGDTVMAAAPPGRRPVCGPRSHPPRGRVTLAACRPPVPLPGRARSVVSATMRPSSTSTWRGSRAAIARSWVITTMVAPSALSSVEQVQDRGAGGAVEVAGGLVGQHDRRPADQGAGDGHPLALAARQLRRPGVWSGGRARPGERRGGPLAAAGEACPGIQQPVGDVVQRAGVLGQEELLEHEADPGGPQRGQLPVGQGGHVEAGDPHRPAVGRSRVPIRCSSVDLPDPDGPTIATSSPCATVKLTPRSATTGGSPG